MLAYLHVPITWRELFKRTYREVMQHDAQGLAAQLAYYFFLSLFPALLCVLAIASFFPLHNFTDDAVRFMGPFAPAEAIAIVREQMVTISDTNHGGLLSLGLLGAIWSSSAAMLAVVSAMNRAYDIDEGRAWWRVRLTAVLLTVGLAVFIVLAFTLIVGGPQIAEAVGRSFGLGSVFVWTWKIIQWPLAFTLAATGIGFIYYFAPDAEQEWVWITPGSLVATTLWLVGSLAFRLYVVNFGSYQATYGAVAGIILLLLWFYMTGIVIVVGAEMSAEIEHASPWAKPRGERVPGEKWRVGLAAARAYEKAGGVVVSDLQAPAPAVRAAFEPKPSFFQRMVSYILVLIRWRNKSIES